eukprot:SAG25_NODE_5582_length_641_cov_1.776753_1_plen_31_part_10
MHMRYEHIHVGCADAHTYVTRYVLLSTNSPL